MPPRADTTAASRLRDDKCSCLLYDTHQIIIVYMNHIENIEEAGVAVRQNREASRMTQAELAAAAGLTRARLSLLERGRANLSLATFLRLAQALGMQLVMEPASERPTLIQLRRAQSHGQS